ncbi:hypothetical protein [Anaplasma phagocytophilum]
MPEYSHIEDPARNTSEVSSLDFFEAALSEIMENGISSKKLLML